MPSQLAVRFPGFVTTPNDKGPKPVMFTDYSNMDGTDFDKNWMPRPGAKCTIDAPEYVDYAVETVSGPGWDQMMSTLVASLRFEDIDGSLTNVTDLRFFEFVGAEQVKWRVSEWRLVKYTVAELKGDARFSATFFEAVQDDEIIIVDEVHWQSSKGANSQTLYGWRLYRP